jgi:2-amino-4-hydroxy-6-hydroxymethyldihydropteridine diphosphokinase
LVNRVGNVAATRRGIYVALGGNVPWQGRISADVLRHALGSFPDIGLQVLAVSRIWESPAWPEGSGAPAYANAVAHVDTTLAPAQVLDGLHALETRFGRVRSEPNAPRTLDLDLIDYRARIEGHPRLPHPRCDARAFVLVPLAEVAPRWRHPVTGVRIDRLLRRVDRTGMRPVAACSD